ncbi:hypothetical protein M3182_24990 [Mesobacillus maritimus]|uniref:hypothetical protein n=1 Tax=Mesobacillus maritimus TaxID=1643336 RepID=UPI0020416D72|nr:hypothetical protein [Mesobacillus maritimus]MCM3588884.1 hypothetical protein [Mesobacillus maritimus]
MVKSLLIYILLSAIILIGYIGSYAISVVLFFFAIGALLLPIVVIGFPILFFLVWKKVLKPIKSKTAKALLLIPNLLLYAYSTYRMDSYISWSEDGNLDIYLSWMGF